VRRSLQFSLFALVLVGLVGGVLAYFLAQKTVTLTVDGQVRHVSTYADTVGEVLDQAGLKTTAHDVVLPAPAQPVGDGGAIVVNRARPLKLTVDGVQRQVYVTALSVDGALAQLGIRADGLVLSASRSERLPLQGMQLTITTPKTVVILVDGQQKVVTTTAATAGDLLREQGIALGPTDRTSLYPQQALLDRMRLQVFRVRVTQVEATTAIAHKTIQTKDPNAFVGSTKVTKPGSDGTRVTLYRITSTDGRVTAKDALQTTVTKAPVDELVTIGTKARPSDGLNWAALARCESGGNPRAVNSAGYYGLYQFSLSTWASVGGSGNPINASPAEQIARAQTLYARGGAGQWGCGRHLFD
jgi:resuscitation-promoting factor RpfB